MCIHMLACVCVCECMRECVCAIPLLEPHILQGRGKPSPIFSGCVTVEDVDVGEVFQQLGIRENVVKQHPMVFPLQTTGKFLDDPAAKSSLYTLLLPCVDLKLEKVAVPAVG